MKSNELMIGDWVCTPIGILKVAEIYRHSIFTEDGEYEGEEVEEEWIKPITLTPEILEKNWWWQDEIDETYHNTLNVYGRKAPFSIFDGVAIYYVHELQHALRLCGLTEIADNFQL